MSSMFDLTGKVGIITGGGGVLGGAMALGLAQQGVQVVLMGRNQDRLNRKAQKIEEAGGKAIGISGDVLSRNDLQKVKDEVTEAFGSIDILINAAGGNLKGATISPEETFFDLSPGDFERVFRLNLSGTVLPCMIFGEAMKEQGSGSIINISSLTASTPFSRVVGYAAAKAAIDNFTKWLAVEMAMKFGEGIRVNAIAPGVFIGEQNRLLLLNDDQSLTERGQSIIDRTPVKRFGQPEELVSTAVYLCSEASGFVTGTIIPVDGGFLAYAGV